MAAKPLRFSELSPERKQLLRICQKLNFGYLENLLIRNQEPIFEGSSPSILLDIKLDGDLSITQVGAAADFELCAEFCRLMLLLDKIVNGRISRIEVRHGVPRKLICEQSFANQTTTDS